MGSLLGSGGAVESMCVQVESARFTAGRSSVLMAPNADRRAACSFVRVTRVNLQFMSPTELSDRAGWMVRGMGGRTYVAGCRLSRRRSRLRIVLYGRRARMQWP